LGSIIKQIEGVFFLKSLKVRIILLFGAVLIFSGFGAIKSEATIAHPHEVYADSWNYGTNGNHGWSYYYLAANVRLGSSSSVKNIYGTYKASDSKNYGEARSDATKSWNDVRLSSFYGWYNF